MGTGSDFKKFKSLEKQYENENMKLSLTIAVDQNIKPRGKIITNRGGIKTHRYTQHNNKKPAKSSTSHRKNIVSQISKSCMLCE